MSTEAKKEGHGEGEIPLRRKLAEHQVRAPFSHGQVTAKVTPRVWIFTNNHVPPGPNVAPARYRLAAERWRFLVFTLGVLHWRRLVHQALTRCVG